MYNNKRKGDLNHPKKNYIKRTVSKMLYAKMKNNFHLKMLSQKEIIIGMMEEALEDHRAYIKKMEALGVNMSDSKDLLIAREITLQNYKEEN